MRLDELNLEEWSADESSIDESSMDESSVDKSSVDEVGGWMKRHHAIENNATMTTMINAHNRYVLSVRRTREWYAHCSAQRRIEEATWGIYRPYRERINKYQAVRCGIGPEFFARTSVCDAES